jgi:MraZ protein
MASFVGTDTYAIDHKGRIALPAWVRRAGGARPLTRFFVNRGFDGCLDLYSPDGWERLMARLRKTRMSDPQGRAFRRAFMVDAKAVSVDAQGRVTLPPALIRLAALDREVVLQGVEDHVEIWNPERHREKVERLRETPGEFESLAEKHLRDEE